MDHAGIQYDDVAGGTPQWATHNVGLLVRLVAAEGAASPVRPFVVATHHLYYRQWYCYLRLRQLHHFARHLAQFNGRERDPVILCGGGCAPVTGRGREARRWGSRKDLGVRGSGLDTEERAAVRRAGWGSQTLIRHPTTTCTP